MNKEEKEIIRKLDLPVSPLEMIFDALTIIGFLALIVMTVYYYPSMPDMVPSHFDASGNVTGWGSRSSMLILPIVGVVTIIVTVISGRFPTAINFPVKITPENAARQLRLARVLLKYVSFMVAGLFIYLTWITARTALGLAKGGTPYDFIVIMVASLAPIIFYFVAALKAR